MTHFALRNKTSNPAEKKVARTVAKRFRRLGIKTYIPQNRLTGAIIQTLYMKPGIDYIGISTPFYCNDGNGLFLLHKRSKNCRDEHDRWDPGSGQLEFGLTPEENVLREITEEYGCRGEIQERLPAYSIFREQNGIKTHWLAVPFFVKVDPKTAKNNEPEKIDQIGWFDLDHLPAPLHSGFQFTFSYYKEYFEKYRRK